MTIISKPIPKNGSILPKQSTPTLPHLLDFKDWTKLCQKLKAKKDFPVPRAGHWIDPTMDIEAYHQHEYLSSTLLQKAQGSPKNLEHYLESLDSTKEKDCFRKGSLVHSLIEQVSIGTSIKKVLQQYIAAPKISLSSHKGVDAGIQFYEKFQVIPKREAQKLDEKKQYLLEMKQASSHWIIKQEDLDLLKGIAAEMERLPSRMRLIKSCTPELSIFSDKRKVRIRPDLLFYAKKEQLHLHISVKTTHNIDRFFYECSRGDMLFQSAMYSYELEEAFNKKFEHLYLVYETLPPYNSRLIYVPYSLIQSRFDDYLKTLRKSKSAIKRNRFGGYELNGVGPLGIEEVKKKEFQK